MNESTKTDLPAKLAKPALRALGGAGITQLKHLTQITESDLKKLHGMGPKAIEELRTALNEKGLSFANQPH